MQIEVLHCPKCGRDTGLADVLTGVRRRRFRTDGPLKYNTGKARVCFWCGITYAQTVESMENLGFDYRKNHSAMNEGCVHWRSLLKIRVRFRGCEEIHTVTSRYRAPMETIKLIDYRFIRQGNWRWRIIEDIHLHGRLFPRWRMVVAGKAEPQETEEINNG